jgi:hypothetical protein
VAKCTVIRTSHTGDEPLYGQIPYKFVFIIDFSVGKGKQIEVLD